MSAEHGSKTWNLGGTAIKEQYRVVWLASRKVALEEYRATLLKIRAHTEYNTPDVALLAGLLASIARITDAALIDKP